MPGPVIKGHEKYENKCDSCHEKLDNSSQKKLCLDCHEDVAKDVKTKKGFHGRYKPVLMNECKTCHIEHVGRDADIVKLNKSTFSHSDTDFKIKGAHALVQCESCHKSGNKYREASSQCYQCHKDNPHKDRLGKKCANCHNESRWTQIKFDHDKTKFKLRHTHEKISCNSCHANGRYKKTPKECVDCHSVDDAHNGKNGKKCAKCHNAKSWSNLKFDHNKETKFSLYGRHKKLDCISCHPKNPYKVKVKKTCVSCHKKDDEHKGMFANKCQKCHSFTKWSKTKFNHTKQAKFALKGKHAKTACLSCHKKPVYKVKPKKTCGSCHAVDDVHKGEQGKQCASCHSEKGWHKKIRFDHDMTHFPLTGMHAVAACEDCHSDQKFKIKNTSCLRCHADDDPHKAKLGPRCDQCHNTNAWETWRFDHNKDTKFKIDGAHKELHCYHCHGEPAQTGINLNQSCGVCHAADDPHNSQFGALCEQCHSTKRFSDVRINQ